MNQYIVRNYSTLTMEVIRCDRQFSVVDRSQGGEVLIALSNKLFYHIIDTSNLFNTVLLIELVLCRCFVESFAFILGEIYIPPSVTSDEMEVFTSAWLTINFYCLVISMYPAYLTLPKGPLTKQICLKIFLI